MPYKSISDLPEHVRAHLPRHAQEIYLAAFNNAYEEYRKPGSRRGEASLDEVAHKVAWAAVKKQYVKKGDRWRRKDTG